MTQATDELQACRDCARALEARLAGWREGYQEYQARLAEFRLRQQDFALLMASWKQEHSGYSPVDVGRVEREITRWRANRGKLPANLFS